MHGSRRALLAVLAVVAVIAVVIAIWPSATGRSTAGPGAAAGPTSTTSSPTSTTTTPVPQPPYAVADETATFTDPNRPTPDRGDVPGHAGRTLVTVIRRPVGLKGPLPLIVFAHGWDSSPAVYEALLDTWAAAGYLVAAPTFPDSASTYPGEPVSNYPEQALDMTFVITQLLAGRGGAGPVNPAKIAVAGHSDGGTDIALLALNPAYADPRIRAYLSLSGEIPEGVNGTWSAPTRGSLFVAVGTDDEYGLYPRAQQIFTSAAMPKVFVTLDGGDHLGTFIGDTAGAVAMRAETLTFLSTAFGSRRTTSAQLAAALGPSAGTDTGVVVTSG